MKQFSHKFEIQIDLVKAKEIDCIDIARFESSNLVDLSKDVVYIYNKSVGFYQIPYKKKRKK